MVKFFFFFIIHLSHVHTLFGSFLPLAPPTLHSRQNLFYTFLQFCCWRAEISNNKKDIAFLLVEIRTAKQILSFHVQMCSTQVDSSLTDLYTGSWSLFHVDLCWFKLSVLIPLEWGHQMPSCFGFSI
jgi:hypothetical protein